MIHNSKIVYTRIFLVIIAAVFILTPSLRAFADDTDKRWVPAGKTQPGESNDRWETVENKSPTGEFKVNNSEKSDFSMAAAVTLTILPGLGAGHFYIGDNHGGWTFLAMDFAIDSLALSTFITFMLSAAPLYTKITLYVVPLTWAVLKAVEITDIVKKVEAANNPPPSFSMIPSETVPSPYMTTVFRF